VLHSCHFDTVYLGLFSDAAWAAAGFPADDYVQPPLNGVMVTR
jgi:hypothetical protein